ncbi:hypothetical protein [Spirosoma luteum]|uniref:hypothetical protein n=1 Tax=Spirosoma luteum TaxID=431553 RepID=UPI00035F8F9B|nr:hypothetical protein [Spirosoma luteum]
MITEGEYLKALEIVQAYNKQIADAILNANSLVTDSTLTLSDLKLSTRAYNILAVAVSTKTNGEVSSQRQAKTPVRRLLELNLTIKDIIKVRNCGKSILNEIELALAKHNIQLP